MRKEILIIGGIALLGVTSPALAQATATPQSKAGAPMADTTAKGFLTHAAQGGMAEVEMGRLASTKAAKPEVKAFAQQMVADHSKANDEVKALAAKKNITLPAAVDAKHKADHDKFAAMSGAAFDRAYVQMMRAEHEKDVAEFKHQAAMNQDADVKAWAAKTLPTLETHLAKVKELEKLVGATN